MHDINIEVLNRLIIGRVEPKIYAFSTNTTPNYLKIGDTYRPIEKRLDEWRRYFPDLERKFSEVAKVNEEIFFRDYAIHSFLDNSGKIRLAKGVFKDLPYFSKEFFKDTDIKDIQEAILDIKDSHFQKDGRYQFYCFEESRIPIDFKWERTYEYQPRPNQQKTIDNFNEALKKGRTNLLMYAVMRFGKSFTSMCCADEMKAKLVVIVSAKSDVKAEWKRTVESHKRFKDYEFFDTSDLQREERALNKKLEDNCVVLFLTLQDLQGDEIKAKHKELFESQIDLLLIDETHFGVRANEYGKVLADIGVRKAAQKKELSQSDDDLCILEERIKTLNAKVRIHLSGTPYRILMSSEFTKDDIIAFYQFTDIVDEQEAWNDENLNKDDVREWDNPYYGFPQMVRFGFNPNASSIKKMEELKKQGVTYALSALLKPQSITKDSQFHNHQKFVHENEILELLEVIDGSKMDDNLLGFLNYDKIKKGNMCRHIVCVLPYRASCDALQSLIINNRDRFLNLNTYEIVNIAGVEDEVTFKDTEKVKSVIKNFETEGKKTLTLTVNRMLTGSTVEQWDTMLYLKDTASPQEYDQAIFRLQNQYIKRYKGAGGDEIQYNMKPQTLLIDFDPYRLFRMQEQKSQIYNANVDDNGNDKLEERIKRELDISPIVILNHNKIHQVVPTDILKAISEYSNNKSVSDEATVIPIDLSLLNDEEIKREIDRQSEINSKDGLKTKSTEGEGDGFEFHGDKDPEEKKGTITSDDSGDNKTTDSTEDAIRKKFATYYSRLLFFAFLSNSNISSVKDILDTIDENEDNIRIARNLEINKRILELLKAKMNPFILSKLDYKLQNINTLSTDDSLPPLERASRALCKFGRLSESEIITPSNIADQMIAILPEDDITAETKILDIAAKQGEFAIALLKKFGDIVKYNIYSVTTSMVAYEFTRKIYEILGMPTENIFSNFTSYDIIGDNKEKILKQFDDMKFNAIVGNPPYQMMDEGHGVSAKPVYDKFVNIGKKLSPDYISMIMPSRWFAGGKGLDEFRQSMLNDKRILKLVDFENSNDIFPGVDVAGGICYFLWDRHHDGPCDVINFINKTRISTKRALNEYSIFIRHAQATEIIKKVELLNINNGKTLSSVISSRKPFGLPTNYKPKQDGVPCWYVQKIGLSFANKADIIDNNILDKWKLLIPPAPIAGQTDFSKPVGFYYDGNIRIAKPGECCTESWIVACAFDTEYEVLSFKSYLFTKIVRFLLLQTVVSQHVTKDKFVFIPDLGTYNQIYTDEYLREKWNITDEEWLYIDSRIK